MLRVSEPDGEAGAESVRGSKTTYGSDVPRMAVKRTMSRFFSDRREETGF